MLVTAKQVSEIARNIIDTYDYDYVGIRIHDGNADVSIGQTMTYISHVWVDGEMTDDMLDGVCAVSVKLAARYKLSFGAYVGSTILILGSNRADSGEDDGEIIMYAPTVLDIMEAK